MSVLSLNNVAVEYRKDGFKRAARAPGQVFGAKDGAAQRGQ